MPVVFTVPITPLDVLYLGLLFHVTVDLVQLSIILYALTVILEVLPLVSYIVKVALSTYLSFTVSNKSSDLIRLLQVPIDEVYPIGKAVVPLL